MLADHYRTFFEALGGALHVRAHSHHPWPDVTRAAQLQYWEDSARLTDRKWSEKIFRDVVPEAQRHVARALGLEDPGGVAFAPNTHEFVVRLYSCLDPARPARVLTTGGEFHSFQRQTRRLEEAGRAAVTRVTVEPFATFRARFRAALEAPCELIYLSHVFFDSGFAVEELGALLEGVPPAAIVAVDGYHAFMAIPVELGALGRRIFYLGGGYKYAQAGEGACFLGVPQGCALRPLDTGWFADFSQLSGPQQGPVRYGEGAQRFWGSTFDASGLYRLNAVMRWLDALGVTPREIHAHSQRLQQRFLDGLGGLERAGLTAASLVPPAGQPRGNFLVFELERAEDVERRLEAHGILVDRRGARLRLGFGLYHDDAFVDALLERLRAALAPGM